MKKSILTASMIMLVVLLSSFTTEMAISDKQLVGTWGYETPDAPYEYQKGDLIFEMKDGKLIGFVSIDGYKIEMEDIKNGKDKFTCDIYVEGEVVTLDLKFTKKAFSGTATYSEGSLDISGSKK